MDKNKLMEQLRKAIREVIQEELGKSSYDATKGISTTELRDKEGKLVGYIKHKNTDGGLVAGGRMGKKAVEKMEKTDETTITIPVAALPSYKKGQQPTVINPQTGEEEVVLDVSSWAKKADENKYSLPAGSMKPKEPVKSQSALEKRFKDLKPGESASLKGDPKKVTPARKKSMEDKAREMGQMDMFTLEEWMGMMEEAGYSLQENDPYRDRNPNPKPEPGEIPQGHGGMIGYRGIPRGPAPKPDPYRDRNPNPEPQPGEIPQGGGGPHIEERYTLEELIGMLEEAGYDTSEVYSLWRPKESGAKSTGVMKDPKKPKTPPAEGDARNNPSSEFSKGLAAWLRAKQTRNK